MPNMQLAGGALMGQSLAALTIPDVPSAAVVQYAKITLTAAQMLLLFTTPVTLLPAPGAGLVNMILDAMIFLNAGTSAFAAGGLIQIIQNAINIVTTSAALINNATSIAIQPAFPGVGTTQSNGAANAATTVNCATQQFTGGAGATVDIHLWYTTVLG